MTTAKRLIKKMGRDWKDAESSARSVARFSANELNNLEECADEVYLALQAIIELGKRDLSNSKYDIYFSSAKEAIENYLDKVK